jgi:hypothetical protein
MIINMNWRKYGMYFCSLILKFTHERIEASCTAVHTYYPDLLLRPQLGNRAMDLIN